MLHISSQTRDPTGASCIWSIESLPLDHQERWLQTQEVSIVYSLTVGIMGTHGMWAGATQTHGSGKSCWNSGTELGLVECRIFLGGLHVWMWELDYKESWALKNWYFWTVVLEKTLESPLDYKEIKPVNPKGNQSWIFIGRTDAEAETPILWPPDAKNWLIGKDPDAGKDWRQEEKGMTEDEMVG